MSDSEVSQRSPLLLSAFAEQTAEKWHRWLLAPPAARGRPGPVRLDKWHDEAVRWPIAHRRVGRGSPDIGIGVVGGVVRAPPRQRLAMIGTRCGIVRASGL